MQRKRFIIQALSAVVLVWSLVFTVQSWASSRKITAERLRQTIQKTALADWSQGEGTATEAGKRRETIREIADITNRLDFQEREKNRENRTIEPFFRSLSASERALFIDLTVAESMNKFMQALDQMPAEERRKFVRRGLDEIEKGRTAENMERTRELGEDVMKRITGEGMRAYFQKASTETKLDLAPLMESMNEVMQGMRGQRFGPPE
jgi:DNA-directed RNA polymerase specialized sigma24 family protein